MGRWREGDMRRLLAVLLMVLVVGSGVQAQEGNQQIVSHVEWSADGERILVTLEQGGLYVIDPNTQTVLSEIPGSITGPIEDAALQPGGNLFATVERFTGLKIWNIETGAFVYSNADLVFSWQVDWSPNGEQVVTGNTYSLSVRDAMGNPLFAVSSTIDDIPRVAFSPNGRLLALGYTYRLEVYDLALRQSVASHIVSGFRNSIQWSADGTMILAAAIDALREGRLYNILVIDPMTGERLRTYSGFPNELTSARWSPDETQIVATSIDGNVYLVEAASGAITSIFSSDFPIRSAAWSPYGGQIAIGVPQSSDAEIAGRADDAFAAVPVQIIVPDPSIERLNAIAAACDAPVSLSTDMADYIAQIEALPADGIPPACAADLLAVARALEGE